MIWDFFKNKREAEPDELENLFLSKMKPGYLVDYDMKTYRVCSRNAYKWQEGGVTDEWELKQGSEVIFLEREEEDGEILWSINIKTAIDALEGDIARHIIDNEDPPDKVVYEGNTYYLEEDDIGEYFKGNSKEGLKFVVWDFIDNKQEKQLSIEQWGETKFDMQVGFKVEEFQFSNILPGE